ncbi:MAG: alpha/beta hydrolase [Myxococcota bacterium]|nr:alpha/beta hydrolase [Myxococcota bacterium]
MAKNSRVWLVGLLTAVLTLAASGCLPTWIGTRSLRHEAAAVGLTERFLKTETATVRFWVGGEGPPLVLVHGFGGTGLSTWAKQMSLAEHHTLVVPDLAWFGQSVSERQPTLDTQVEVLLDLMEALSLDPVDVVGVSYGGFVVLELVQAAPNRVGRAVIVDSPGPFFGQGRVEELLVRAGVDSLVELFVPEDAAGVDRLFTIALAEPPRIPRWLLSGLVGSFLSAHPEQQAALLADLLARSGTVDSASLVWPEDMLVVWGASDQVFPTDCGRELAAAASAEFVLLEQAAHSPNIDTPDAFNRVVSQFLERR